MSVSAHRARATTKAACATRSKATRCDPSTFAISTCSRQTTSRSAEAHQPCPWEELSFAFLRKHRFSKLSRDVSPVGRLLTFVPGDVSTRIRPITGRPSLLPISFTRIPVVRPRGFPTEPARRHTGLLRSMQIPHRSLRSRYDTGASDVREWGSGSPIALHVPFGSSLTAPIWLVNPYGANAVHVC